MVDVFNVQYVYEEILKALKSKRRTKLFSSSLKWDFQIGFLYQNHF